MGTIASQITSLTIDYSTVYSPVNYSRVTGEFPAQMVSNAENFQFDDVIMIIRPLCAHEFHHLPPTYSPYKGTFFIFTSM